MKRLPFALIALSLSIPVVACLNNAGEEDIASGENDLSQGARDACNFGFTEVDKAIVKAAGDAEASKLVLTSAVGITPGQKLLWGDFDGDGNKDFAQVTGAEQVQVYNGDGKGAFVKAKKAIKLPNIDGRKRTAIAIVASGDFDGDGKSDLAAIATSHAKDAATEADKDASRRGDVTILYGSTGDTSLEAPSTAPSLAEPITDWTYYHAAGDLDGDGKDDLVITTEKGEILAFGEANRTLKEVPSGLSGRSKRSLAFISPKTADKPAELVIATPTAINTITFDADRNPSPKKTAYKFPTKTSNWTSTDLDQNGENEIAILGSKGLSVIPVTATQAKSGATFEKVPGELIGSADLDGNKSSELLYKVDDSQLYAACGAGEHANEIVAAPLKVAYSKDVIVAGQVDLNNDGKADLVTLDISDEKATRGTVKVYLSSGPETPAPELSIFSVAGGTSDADAGAGADASATSDEDATTTDTDASAPDTDASTSDTDASAPDTDAGPKDAGTAKDAGSKDAGAKKDAGASKPDDADDDGSDEGDDDPPSDDEGTGTKNDKPSKRPTTKPSNGASTGSANVSILPKTQTADDGCSAAPGSHGLSSSAFGGLFAAMMLLGRRRRKNQA